MPLGKKKSPKKKKSSKRSSSKRGKIILPTPTKNAMDDYSTKKPQNERIKSLKKLVRKNGYKTTIMELSLRRTFNKNNKDVYNKMTRDMERLKREYRPF